MKGGNIGQGPRSALRERIAKRNPVILIDEYNTSQMCSSCGRKTCKMEHNGNKVHGILHCANEGKSWNRDHNACNNFENIFRSHLRGEDRPIYLRRTPKIADVNENNNDGPPVLSTTEEN